MLKMDKKYILGLFMLVLALMLSSIVSSDEYKQLGVDEYNSFNIDIYGDWNDANSLQSEESIGLIDPYMLGTVKSAVLGDGEQYIIAFSSGTLGLYQYENGHLNSIDGFYVPYGINQIEGDFIVHDRKIIIPIKNSSHRSGVMYIEFNGTAFINSTLMFSERKAECSYRLSEIGYNKVNTGCPTMLKCNDDDECVAVYPNLYNMFTLTSFNESGEIQSHNKTTYSGVINRLSYSFPVVPSFVITELNDGDSYTDIIVSYSNIWMDGASKFYYYIVVNSFDLYPNGSIYEQWQTDIVSDVGGIGPYIAHCRDDFSEELKECSWQISSPTAINFDGFASNGYEIMVGYAIDYQDDFKVAELKSTDGSITQYHPDSFNLEGFLISNPFRIDCYPDSNQNELGILSYDETHDELILLCSTSSSAYANDDCEYSDFSLTGFQIDSNLYTIGSSIHSFNADSDSQDEIMTSWGVLNPESPSFFPITNICTSDIEQYYTFSNESVYFYIPNDYQNVSRADIIYSGEGRLGYIDDGFTNDGAEIDNFTIDPCINGAWALNTTVGVYVRAIDDYDMVQSRVYLYYNTPYEKLSNWSTAIVSGNTAPHLFVNGANVTIGTGTVRIEVRDTNDPSDIDYAEELFSVDNTGNGFKYGDCTTTFDYETSYDEDEEDSGTGVGYIGTESDNSLKSGAENFAKQTNLPVIVIFLIVLFIILYQIWVSPMTENNPQVTLGVIVLTTALFLIIGAKIGIVSFGLILTISVIGLIPIGIWIGRKMLGHGHPPR